MEGMFWCLYHSLTGNTGLSKESILSADELDKTVGQRLLTHSTASIMKSLGRLGWDAVTEVGSTLHTVSNKSQNIGWIKPSEVITTSDLLNFRNLKSNGEKKGERGAVFIKHVHWIYFDYVATLTLFTSLFSDKSCVKKRCLFVSEVL